ncbi:unnamed protein product, partial [marine sediment metagenome]
IKIVLNMAGSYRGILIMRLGCLNYCLSML